MKLQKQIKVDDCLIACICSLIDFDINKAPEFDITLRGEVWNNEIKKWLETLGYSVTWYDSEMPKNFWPKNMIYIASGTSAYNKKYEHAVLWKNGKLYFDPSPLEIGSGIIGDPKYYYIVFKMIMDEIK